MIYSCIDRRFVLYYQYGIWKMGYEVWDGVCLVCQ